MSKKAIIILAEGFEELEAVTVIDILRRAGISVTVCGLGKKEVKGSRGTMIITDRVLEESDLAKSYDTCILPGGMPGAERLANSDIVGRLLVKMRSKNKVIAAICASPALVLSPLGILENRKATCYPGMEGLFPESTQYGQDNVIADGNLITSRGPATALEFAISVAGALCGKDIAKRVRKAVLA